MTGACALSAHAQKQLKYVPQAMKSVKAVPYVVNPRISPAVRTGFAMPVVRPQAVPTVRPNIAPVTSPNVSAAVERQVAKKAEVQERIARLESNLSLLEEYARTHGNRLPLSRAGTAESKLRAQVIGDIVVLKKGQLLPEGHSLFRRYNQLLEAEQALQPTPQDRIERLETNLNKLEEYARTHDNRLPLSRAGTAESTLRDQVIGDIVVLKRGQVLPEGHPLFQRYNQLLEIDKQQCEKEAQQRKILYDEQRQQKQLARKEQERQGKLVRAEQREQEKLAREEQERQEKLVRAEQREHEKLAREEQQQQEEQFIRELRAQEQATEERAWQEVLLQDQAWKAQAEETLADPAENADKAATLVEQQFFTPTDVTDDYINQLLRFYNKLDPMGTGTIQ